MLNKALCLSIVSGSNKTNTDTSTFIFADSNKEML